MRVSWSLVVEQAELDALGVLGEEREVRAAAVPGRAERERMCRARRPSAANLYRLSREVGDELDVAAAQAQHARRPRRPRRPRARAAACWRSCEQLAVERDPARAAAELRAQERLGVLRVGDVLAGEGGEAPRTRCRRPSRVASAIAGSMWSVKNWNGRRSPYSSPMKSSGVCGARRASRRRATRSASGGRRSPSARLPTWSWFCAQTTSRSDRGRAARSSLRRARRPTP